MNAYVREPVNAFTHLGGAILSFVALLAMLVKVSVKMPSVSTISAVILFGVGMMILYAASTVYHSVVASERVIYFFRKLDHSMIFLLIAGTYAPFCLITLQAANGLLLFVLVYATAICGIVFKMFWFNCPRWLSTAIYLMMGWLIVLFFAPLSENLSMEGILFLVLGGIFYTIGGFIYGAKPKWLEFKYMGHHEIFHIFVLLGSLAHFLCIYFYVI
ncbi:hemolysin III family protein [Bacillus sp. XF8]|uniref:PAQR family membrane homeostasis protein TrhA n=1 Tax=Bacillus sp. XF8 TaxID=2819289 RepID=UPI001AA0213D|nr:hemolysin III family protein [Bacillus sp. XF8]MBO1582047.1 hemolysin III family protein [Bacillus sp. XF8]